MNLLWIMADQMRADCVGFAGHPVVRTPHLDALAHRGVVFANAFGQSPICTPSRTCYFTGRYVHGHGAWWNGVPMSRERILLPQLLRQQGYSTGLTGKLHFFPQDHDHGFGHKEVHEEHLPTELSAYNRFLQEQDPPSKRPAQYTEWMADVPFSRVGICHMDERIEETRWAADRACAFLRAQTGKPFFLYASFLRPHSPYNPLSRFAELYQDVEIKPPEFCREEWDRVPPRVRAIATTHGWAGLHAEDFVTIRRHYYALCSQVDEHVGQILSCVEEQGLAESTIVVFAADHGDFVGEHGWLGKSHPWDGSLHVTLIIYDPRRKGRPLSYSGLVETVDVMPTLLDLLDIAVPSAVQGKTLVPVMEDAGRPHRDAVFSEFASYGVQQGVRDVLKVCRDPNIVSVRTDRWKYIHYVDEDGELYDLQNDPGERRNLFSDPALQSTRDELKERLLDWLVATNDNTEPDRDNSYFRSFFNA